ncbi:MAG: hypothetical protein JWN49_113 [Parcubacteria group bacterium]|nr:hypothetical protein [Parcubacteria group bacterium]
MSEHSPSLSAERERRNVEYVRLAESLSQRPEAFPFTGIDPIAYAALKAGEAESPGFVTPIDERIRKLTAQGLKVVLGKYKDSGNVFIVPALSDNVREDMLQPRHLTIVDGMDEELKKLILANKK